VPSRIKWLTEDGVSLRDVDLAALGANTDLPYEIGKYFLPRAGAFLLPLENLIVTRARPDGIANAGRLMRAAYDGQHSRRAPVSVQAYCAGDFLVEDGNSTVLNAVASNWSHVLCVAPSTAG
jgi:hypothetical protein